jgi:dUTP pyrophosphatase
MMENNFNDIPEFKELNELKDMIDTLNNSFGENIMGEDKTNELNSLFKSLNDLDNNDEIKFINKSNNPDPLYTHEGDSGFDIRAYIVEQSITLKPLERKLIPTGLSFELLPNTELQIRPRSGMALNHGITVLNTPGTVDQGYRGEVGVILINLSSEEYTITNGDRIAQGVIMDVRCKDTIKLVNSDSLNNTDRGKSGFGSTGKK